MLLELLHHKRCYDAWLNVSFTRNQFFLKGLEKSRAISLDVRDKMMQKGGDLLVRGLKGIPDMIYP
jgi:hypothetical protein